MPLANRSIPFLPIVTHGKCEYYNITIILFTEKITVNLPT